MVVFIKKVDDIVGNICSVLSFCGTMLAFFMMMLVVVDVGGRVLFHSPLLAAFEIIRACVPAITFLMLPWASHEMRHIRTTLVYGRVPYRARIVIDVLAYALGFILLYLIFRACWPNMIRAFTMGAFEGDGALVRIPTFPSWVILVLSSVLTMWQMLRALIISILHPKKEMPLGE